MKPYMTRTILMIGLVAFLTGNVFTSNGYIEPQSSQPSLNETLEWLKGKLIGNRTLWNHSRDIDQYETITGFGFDGCQISIIKKTEYHQDGGDSKIIPSIESIRSVKLQFSLSDVSTSAIRVEPYSAGADCQIVRLPTYNNQEKVISQVLSYTIDTREPGKPDKHEEKLVQPSKYQSGVSFFISDKDTADRIAKAFTHAVTLCGGKKEPF